MTLELTLSTESPRYVVVLYGRPDRRELIAPPDDVYNRLPGFVPLGCADVEKSSITSELVHRLVAAQFPHWADLPIAPVDVDGWDNSTFRLGSELSVRLPSAETYVAQVEKEHRWLPFLAPRLSLPIPQPVAQGSPGFGYPWPWSVYRWLEGDTASAGTVADRVQLADDLAAFLSAFQAVDSSDGPEAGRHSAFRGAPLAVYDQDARRAIAALAGVVDAGAATAAWERALAAEGRAPRAWVHGDLTPSNLLVRDGRLAAVIDFGCLAVGDPACDLAIAWTSFEGESRAVFRDRLRLDDATWERGRGWALWKALITLAGSGGDPEQTALRFGWRAGPGEIVADLARDPGA
jgi:aminoglycoside phosphotransferase (APT) family kinase protein